MKAVKVPEAVRLKDLTTGQEVDGAEWSLHRFITSVVLPDTAMGKGYKADRVRCQLDDAFRDAKPGDEVRIEDDWFERVKKTVEAPEGDFPPQIRMQFMPHMDALVNAEEVSK